MAAHTRGHIALIPPFVCHADHNSQSFVWFSFLYKNTSACYTSDWKGETQNPICVLICKNVDRFIGTYIWHIHIRHIYIWEENMSQRPIQSWESSSPSIFPSQEEREPGVVVHAWEAETGRLQVCAQLGQLSETFVWKIKKKFLKDQGCSSVWRPWV